jgi:hypothetical protein
MMKAAEHGPGLNGRGRVRGRPLAGREPPADVLMRARRVEVGLVLTNTGPELPLTEYQDMVEQLAPEDVGSRR